MKKNHCNICTMNLLLLALSTGMILLTSCTNTDDPVLNDISTENTYTITIDATLAGTDANQTRALGFDGSALKSTWAATDKVSVYYKDKAVGTLTPTSTGMASTTLMGALSFASDALPNKSDKLKLYFPDKEVSYEGQDGTLATIASNTDYAQAEVSMTTIDDANKTITAAAATFTKQQAIVKFTLKDKDGNSINASNLTVNGIIITPASAADEFYIAMPGINTATVKLNASVGCDIYTYGKSDVTFANGNYYTVTVKMDKMEEAVQLWEDGPYWATMNIGASNSYMAGDYFQWGNLNPSERYENGTNRFYNKDLDNPWVKYITKEESPLDMCDDAARTNWGAPWRMPTQAEFQALLDNTTRTEYQGDNKWRGFNGMLLTGKGSFSDKFIFIPTTGYITGTTLYGKDTGHYWSACQSATNYAVGSALECGFSWSNCYIEGNQAYRSRGCAIRPVHD